MTAYALVLYGAIWTLGDSSVGAQFAPGSRYGWLVPGVGVVAVIILLLLQYSIWKARGRSRDARRKICAERNEPPYRDGRMEGLLGWLVLLFLISAIVVGGDVVASVLSSGSNVMPPSVEPGLG